MNTRSAACDGAVAPHARSSIRPLAARCVAGGVIAAFWLPGPADAASNQELEALVRAQARVIAQLNARLERVEKRQDDLTARHTKLVAR